MKILFDHQIFSLQKYGGVSRYFCELIKNIPPEHEFDLSLFLSDNYYLKENYEFFKKINIVNFKGKHLFHKKIFSINKYYSKRYISRNDFDIFHPTYYDNYFLKILKKPYTITVHDLIIFKFKDTFYKTHTGRLQIENVIKNATRIISISENTKKDLIEIFNINPQKIDVIYHGYNKTIPVKNLKSYGKYILFVGRRDLYKNFILFAEAISELLRKEKDIQLVCVGPSLTKEESAFLTALGIIKQIIVTNVDDSSLNALYSNALVFVYPSLYEGFGMPILEAFANNCPVCLSNTSCFPEIAGCAAVYFDPYSRDSILDAIQKVIYDTDHAKKIKEEGTKRLIDFSWEKVGKETVSSYRKTI